VGDGSTETNLTLTEKHGYMCEQCWNLALNYLHLLSIVQSKTCEALKLIRCKFGLGLP